MLHLIGQIEPVSIFDIGRLNHDRLAAPVIILMGSFRLFPGIHCCPYKLAAKIRQRLLWATARVLECLAANHRPT
jgi:hypothetical protein